MKQKFYSFLLTALLGFLGMNAWAQDLNTTIIDGVEYYEIGDATDLVAFAQIVNNGEQTANAILTADIDCSSISSWTSIGIDSKRYKGTFDGQGHVISNLNISGSISGFGLFYTTAGVTLKNFIIDSSCSFTSTKDCIGVVGKHVAQNLTEVSTFSGIGCAATISSSASENPAGIIGGCWGQKGVEIIIDKCWTGGTITSSDAKKSNTGAFVGWLNGGTLVVSNSWSIATVNTPAADKYLVRAANNSNTAVTFSNCYSLNGTQVTKLEGVTAADLSTGAITYAVNGNSSENPIWFQTLKSKAFYAEQYVVTVNGQTQETQNADVILLDAGDGTYSFTLPNFVLHTFSQALTVGDITLPGVTIDEDGTFSQAGTFSVPDENIPDALAAMADRFKNIPYTLEGKVNETKLYATIHIDLDMGITTYSADVVAGIDDFDAVAPTGDPYPRPYGTDVVYQNGRLHCNGTMYEGSYYSNEDMGMEQDEHDFVDGFCSYCGFPDETYMTANESGIYEIGTANQLKWFAAYVNQVNPAADAILVANIDMTGEEWTPIGKNVAYGGTFDGQNFTISNLNYIGSGDYNGLFGRVIDATVKNFSINGSLVCAGQGNGTIGWGEGAIISNVHSTLIITTPATGAIVHGGGIIGDARYSSTGGGSTIEHCSFTGTLTVNADSHDCFGGIVGYVNDYCLIQDCANYGTITYAKNNCYLGGILGYVNNNSCYGTHNCLNTGDIIYAGEGEPSYGGAIVGRLRNNNPELWGDSYYREGSASQACGENQIPTNYVATDAQLASGEIAYKLGAAWGQEIGVEPYPVLDGKKVFEFGDTYANIEAESGNGNDDCILPSMRWGGNYQAYTYVAQGNFDFGDWNTSNPNYNVIIGVPEEQDDKAWYTPGYNVTNWNYGKDLPEFGDGRPADVYAVRFFTVDGEIPSTLYMPAAHDDAPCEYYINGEQIFAETDGWFEEEVVRLTDEQKALIKTDGTINVFAFHVHQNWGGRYADGGLYTAGAPVDAFNNDANKKALDATIAIMEDQGIGAEEIEFASNINYRNGFAKGLAQLRKARQLAFDARTENFTGSEPADGMIAYILNVGAKMFLAGGNDWGTHASLNHMGAKCVLHANTSGANRYTIQTNLPNGVRGRNDALGHNGYVDCGDWNTTGNNWAWEIAAQADGTYNIINCENSGANIYLGMTDDDRLQVDTDKSGADNEFNKWIFVTPEEFLALAEDATAENPVDLGHLVHQATFSQNDFDGNDKWASNCTAELGDSKWERNAGGIWGWKENWTGDLMFEMWNTASIGYVYLIQEVEGLPAGKYTVQMNGYYRDGNFESADEGNVRQLAYLFAGTEENCVPLVNIVDGSGNYPGYGRGGASGIVIPDGCGDAARFFHVGTYVNTIEAQVGVDGKLRIGVFRNGGDIKGGDWITTDNWRLYYQGRSLDAEITEAGYATFVAPWNINAIPEGVEAFAAQVNKNQEGYVHLEPVTTIPAGEAVVLKGAEGIYTVYGTSEAVELGADNDLIAATEEVTADGTQYILAKVEDVVGFAQATPNTTIAAGKGYLVIEGTGVKPFYPFGADGATGIANALKADENNIIYNVAGQRLSKMQKGINIVGNKKVLY